MGLFLALEPHCPTRAPKGFLVNVCAQEQKIFYGLLLHVPAPGSWAKESKIHLTKQSSHTGKPLTYSHHVSESSVPMTEISRDMWAMTTAAKVLTRSAPMSAPLEKMPPPTRMEKDTSGRGA